MKAQAGSDIQRNIKRMHAARTACIFGIALSLFAFSVDMTVAPVLAILPATLLVVFPLLIVVETRLIGRLQRREQSLTALAVRPQAYAEQVAEAVEARRQRQWDAITRQAYRARPPDPKRLAAIAGTSLGEALSPPMTSMALGMARLTAATGGCAHLDAEPVNLLLTGETVAWVCPACEAGLPADWRS